MSLSRATLPVGEPPARRLRERTRTPGHYEAHAVDFLVDDVQLLQELRALVDFDLFQEVILKLLGLP